MNPIELPQTPLQRALQGPDAPQLLAAQALRLQHCRRQVTQRLDEGLAPAHYARYRQLLAMCDAALRTLQTLSPTPERTSTGPAAALPRRPLTA